MEALTLEQFMAVLGRNSLQAAVLVLAVLLAQWLSGRRLAPRWRCALWLLVVLRLCVPFSFSSTASVFNLLPGGKKSAATAPLLTAMPQVPQEIESTLPVQIAETPKQELQPAEISPAIFPAPSTLPATAVRIVPQLAPPKSAARFSWSAAAFWIWLAGTTILLGHVLISSLRLARRFGRLHPLTEQSPLAVLADCCQRLKVRTNLQLVESVELGAPALHGIFRPRLLVPKGFTAKFSADELRFVFLHELAHLKRRDLLVNWVMTFLQAVHWFNPLVWLGFARWRADRELACDAMVLETAGAERNKEYGRTILRLLENFTSPRRTPGLAGILEDKRQLSRRIGMIADYVPSPRWSLLAIVLTAALAVGCLTDARSHAADGAASIAATPAATNQAELRLSVELRDGSRVVGTSAAETLKFRSTLFGNLKLALKNIRAVEFLSTNSAKLTAINSDTITVSLADSVLPVKTSFGKVELAAGSLRKFTVSGAGATGGHHAGLVALWSGEGNANDSVGENQGKLLGSVGFATGKIGQAFDLNSAAAGGNDGMTFTGFRSGPMANNGYILVSTTPALNVGAGEGFTFEAWLKPSTISREMLIAEYEKVLGTPDGADVGVDFAIQQVNGTGDWRLYGNVVEPGASHELFSQPGLLRAGVWQHVALTYDKASGNAAVYLNGETVATKHVGSIVPITSYPYLVLGARTTFGSASNPRVPFSGGMDEIGIYDRALSAEEIREDFESGNQK